MLFLNAYINAFIRALFISIIFVECMFNNTVVMYHLMCACVPAVVCLARQSTARLSVCQAARVSGRVDLLWWSASCV